GWEDGYRGAPRLGNGYRRWYATTSNSLSCRGVVVLPKAASATTKLPTETARRCDRDDPARALRLPGLVNRELLHIGRPLHFHACCVHSVLHTTSEERIELGSRLPEVDDSPALIDRTGRVE